MTTGAERDSEITAICERLGMDPGNPDAWKCAARVLDALGPYDGSDRRAADEVYAAFFGEAPKE